MLPTLRSRRRPRYGAHVCAVIAALLLLLSVSLLHTRLSQPHNILQRHRHQISQTDSSLVEIDPLVSDSDDSSTSSNFHEDRIDELDTVDEDDLTDNNNNDDDDEVSDQDNNSPSKFSSSGYYFDHVTGSIRRALNKQSIDDWDYDYTGFKFPHQSLNDEKKIKGVFGSDDVPVDEETRRKMSEVRSIEEALLLLKVSPLREKWGEWFDKKSEFLRRDKMFRSHLEVLNPGNNPLLQDPDGVGVSGLTRGDKAVQKWLLNEFKRTQFVVVEKKKPLVATKRTTDRRRTLDDERTNEFSSHVYADGKTWGYYPGLHPKLSFSGFMDAFFRKGKCSVRVFMVWNSPPWMFSVRHQRGLESLLVHHRDACVVVFSETIELDFFNDGFVKDGYKVAVVMPNLDELLKDTPAHIFASVWFEWRKTKFYNTHYSELVRLAALYKYGGIYIDSDVIVLKPLSSLNNTVGLEDSLAGSSLNGAVMAFRKHSPFILECLKEFYLTYDDTNLRWNGADLLTRVARKFWHKEKRLELKVQPSFIFFPIGSQNITRYFTTPAAETEKAQQDDLFKKILDVSLTFHFWNSLTSTFIPEPDSLASRLMNYFCIHCFDVL